ncbi:uncharacterized protein LOC134460454 [Engraulis encrasicolus]|uniref:uncharacterized protein LOC134460454 n=1 Tax=Engraulis encrasicolus TaxID=184585 RepID=UPI002FCFD5C9
MKSSVESLVKRRAEEMEIRLNSIKRKEKNVQEERDKHQNDGEDKKSNTKLLEEKVKELRHAATKHLKSKHEKERHPAEDGSGGPSSRELVLAQKVQDLERQLQDRDRQMEEKGRQLEDMTERLMDILNAKRAASIERLIHFRGSHLLPPSVSFFWQP